VKLFPLELRMKFDAFTIANFQTNCTNGAALICHRCAGKILLLCELILDITMLPTIIGKGVISVCRFNPTEWSGNMNQNPAIPVKAKPLKLSCDNVQDGRRAAGCFPNLPRRLWCRVVFISVLLIVIWRVDIASATTLVNGASQAGTLLANTTNFYTFTANKGDSINVRLGTTGFYGEIQLFGPNGALLRRQRLL
jgi:hypothetical protein